MKARKLITILILITIIFTSTIVFAHKPIYTDEGATTIQNAQKIDEPEISWAIYGELTEENDVYFYKVEGKKGMDLYVQMTIPKIKGNENFTPTIGVLGKEFEKTKDELPFEVPEGYGVKIIEPTEVKRDFFEPFTQTNYLMRQEETIKLKNDDTYYIAVYDKEKRSGKYTLAVGKEEEFGMKDALMFPYTWLRVRLWYNTSQTFLIIGGVILLIWGFVKVVKMLKKKKQ